MNYLKLCSGLNPDIVHTHKRIETKAKHIMLSNHITCF